MGDLISRSALIKKLEEHIEYDFFDIYHEEPLIKLSLEMAEDIIGTMPTVEAEPVVYGEWVEVPYVYIGLKRYICSNCYDDEYWKKRYLTTKERYCPNCGAKTRDK